MSEEFLSILKKEMEIRKKMMTPQAQKNKKKQVGTMSELLNILKKKNKLPFPKMEIERCPEILKKRNEQPPQKMEIQLVDEHVTEEGAGLSPMPPSPTPLPVEWWRTSQVIGDSLVFYWTDGVSRVPDTSGGAADISEMKVHMTF